MVVLVQKLRESVQYGRQVGFTFLILKIDFFEQQILSQDTDKNSVPLCFDRVKFEVLNLTYSFRNKIKLHGSKDKRGWHLASGSRKVESGLVIQAHLPS